MKKTYFTLEADVLILLEKDVISTSNGENHGMGDGVVSDEDWQVGKG